MAKININVEMTPEEFDEYRKFVKDKKYYVDIRTVKLRDVLDSQLERVDAGEFYEIGFRGYRARYQSSNKKVTVMLEARE
jgi:hypothetical protein